jgi:hypothetical protein
MPETNFDLAPPSKTVDGIKAVPIDIQRVTAALTFDGATSSGVGDATLEFITGAESGCPIFDLRQTLTGATLDGSALPVAKLAHHDFGGGPNAQLRVVESVLAPGTPHKLRVTYGLGPPQASNAGSYLPAMTWGPGPRLAFNFGFTDLGAGRYLESWVPANLIYDQFELLLTVRLLNTPVAHSVITNGVVTPLGPNHWSVAFPARFTALSPLFEVRATDTLATQSSSTTLPVSGATVSVEAWKLASDSTNLATQVGNIKTFLAANENSTGPYLHGNRFVAFFRGGGMEYEGGTTASTSSLRHETFHSWWARGLKPASQPDGWWDEAWTVYNDNGASGSLPFDFTDPPVTLCTRNPWSRVTAGEAYTAGNRFFEGAAALVGVASLKSLMSDFYKGRGGRPARTTDIEEFLVCRTGNAQLVDAFHRFVYGFGDPAPAPDLWIKDEAGHTGGDAFGGAFWNSPDLWVRNADDNGTTHQDPIQGRDNFFYARVRNRSASGAARHFLVAFNVKPFAGLEFLYPADFLPCVAAGSGFELGAGQTAVVKARWPKEFVPPAGTHACWLASVLTRSEHPVAGRHVWEHNNLAQKNLTIISLAPDQWFVLPLVLRNLRTLNTRRVSLELIRPKGHARLEASLLHGSGDAFDSAGGRRPKPFKALGDTARAGADERQSLDCGGAPPRRAAAAASPLTSDAPAARAAQLFSDALELTFPAGLKAQLPVSLKPAQQLVLGLRLRVPPTAKAGDVLTTNIVQRDAGNERLTGGYTVEIHVK